jgi:hypothetical protein
MKKILLIVLLAAISTSFSFAQTSLKRKCAADEVFERQNLIPEVAQQREQIEQQTRQFMMRKGSRNARTGVLTIPVVVHVIYNTSQENISDAQIQSQIDVLNEDFRRLNSDAGNVPSEFAGLATDAGIEFQLVQVTRKQSSRTSWGTNDDMKKSSQGGVDPWDPSEYMNMWICNIGGGILGYAQFPGGPAATDGVVFSPQYCGSRDKEPAGENFYLSAPFDKGRTATHEVGHYLNLRHIWGDGNCSADDYVSDTPIAGAPNYGCPSYPSKSCSSNGGYTSDMFMNYMDYVDDACMNMFTTGQKARMDALFAAGGARETLGTTSGGGTPPPSPDCATGALTLSLTFDNYPSETSWSLIKDGSTVATGSGYSTKNGTITENFDFGDGNYEFVINDQYGDGICCSYGNGSYTITDASGTVVASGGSFASTETKAFCVEGSTSGGGTCDPGAVTLTLKLDNYPSETSWSLTQNGSTLASGSGYSTKGATITETFDFGTGDFDFTINDQYGDGICCSYGNGFYELKDSNGNVLASGGSFGSSETSTYNISCTAKTTVAQKSTTARKALREGLNLFPNPAQGHTTLSMALKGETNVNMVIYDIQGRVIQSQQWENVEGLFEHKLKLTDFNKGMYFININTTDGYQVREKLMINK